MFFLRPGRLAALALGIGLLTVVAVGCAKGPPTGQVQGKVTFKGKPVAEGTVTFLNPKEGGTAEAALKPDGSFAVPTPVVVGDYLVTVTPVMVMVDTDPGKSPPAPTEKKAPDIPPKYRMQGTTPLRAPVKPGLNEFAFDLTP